MKTNKTSRRRAFFGMCVPMLASVAIAACSRGVIVGAADDSSEKEGGTDEGGRDASLPDASLPDASLPDASLPDAGVPDEADALETGGEDGNADGDADSCVAQCAMENAVRCGAGDTWEICSSAGGCLHWSSLGPRPPQFCCAGTCVGAEAFEKRVADVTDDAEEWVSPTSSGVDVVSSDLEMTHDINADRHQVIGIRFTQIMVPPASTIVGAYVQFSAKFQIDANSAESDPVATILTAKAEALDNPAGFFSTAPGTKEISGAPMTNAEAVWRDIPFWQPTPDAAGPDQRTPSLAAVVQEIVDRPGWASGNAMVFVVTGTGTRSAHSYSATEPNKAPLLHIDYLRPRPRDGGRDSDASPVSDGSVDGDEMGDASMK